MKFCWNISKFIALIYPIHSETPSPRVWHSGVRITGLSDMTLKQRSRVAVGVAHKRTLTAKDRSKFAPLSLVMVTVAR
jgi:hypothetical protein